MFIQLLAVSIGLLFVPLHAQIPTPTNSSQGQKNAPSILPKQASLYDDYDLNDPKASGNRVEGSGGAASLDEYADDEEEEQLSKITATTVVNRISTLTSTTTTSATTTAATKTTAVAAVTTTTTTTTRMSTTIKTIVTTKRTSMTASSSNPWLKTSVFYDSVKKKNTTSTTTISLNDLDTNEFKEDPDEYADDLEDDAYYNEPTISNKVATPPVLMTRYPVTSTRPSILSVNHTAPIWILFSFLTRPPIAAGILAGKFSLQLTVDMHSTPNRLF
jgi:hypothetical protein